MDLYAVYLNAVFDKSKVVVNAKCDVYASFTLK
jgi:hypothetical protein